MSSISQNTPQKATMTISDLTQLMNDFVNIKGWNTVDSSKKQTPRNIAISLSLEVAEVLEHFQWGETSNDTNELGNELADVALYLFQLADITGIDLEQAIHRKLDINYTREWLE